ncbi:MAG: TIR domain-containing protein, partial [Caulobacteraceae bacterium]
MADIFISYARPSAPEAHRVAEALRALGYGVWRDDDLPPHRSYAEVIEERLREAKAVIVLWSKEAAHSQWVRAEANLAREQGTLIQVALDGVVPPLPFNQIQCCSLADWSGDADHHDWCKVTACVAEMVSGAPPPREPAADRPMSPKKPKRTRLSIVVLPFANMSRDPEQEYFVDGVTESLTTDLSRIHRSFVIARNTAF